MLIQLRLGLCCGLNLRGETEKRPAAGLQTPPGRIKVRVRVRGRVRIRIRIRLRVRVRVRVKCRFLRNEGF